jgi:hypothetical protein
MIYRSESNIPLFHGAWLGAAADPRAATITGEAK